MLEKQLRIGAGIDLHRALHCMLLYLVTPNAQRIGNGSLVIYTNEADTTLMVYATKTAYIIRKVE